MGAPTTFGSPGKVAFTFGACFAHPKTVNSKSVTHTAMEAVRLFISTQMLPQRSARTIRGWMRDSAVTSNVSMRAIRHFVILLILILCFSRVSAAADSPVEHLPPYITQLTAFGERADWSHDGRKILFLSKTFGDAMEIDLETKSIHNLTAHYPHHGYTRALYLANDDILLSGPEQYDPKRIGEARVQCFVYVLDKKLTAPARPLGTKSSEGPAVSRKRMHVPWNHAAGQQP